MTYVLESKLEFERLEKQSRDPAYDFTRELDGITFQENSTIIDAGCGSGAVSRYLAAAFPRINVIGCDAEVRTVAARKAATGIANLRFETQNLSDLRFPDDSVDGVVCRFVLEHLTERVRERALREILRICRPGARIVMIDLDGILLHICRGRDQQHLAAQGRLG